MAEDSPEAQVVWIHPHSEEDQPEYTYQWCPGDTPAEMPGDVPADGVKYCDRHQNHMSEAPVYTLHLNIALVGLPQISEDMIRQFLDSMPKMPNYVTHDAEVFMNGYPLEVTALDPNT